MDSFSLRANNGAMIPIPFDLFDPPGVAPAQTEAVSGDTAAPRSAETFRPVTYGPLTDLGAMKPPTGGPGRLNVVLEGDSLTVGYGPRFQIMMDGEKTNVNNDAVSDETVVQMLTQVPELSRKYKSDAKDNIMVLWAGTNDLCWGEGGDPVKAFNHLKDLAGAYSRQGFKVMVLTLGYTRPSTMSQANAYNALVKSAKGPWDAVLDLTRIPTLEGLLENDMVHYTPVGYQKIADEVEKSLIKLGWMG